MDLSSRGFLYAFPSSAIQYLEESSYNDSHLCAIPLYITGPSSRFNPSESQSSVRTRSKLFNHYTVRWAVVRFGFAGMGS